MAQRPAQYRGKGRLLLFAFGDFAFNLYWQSIMLFLLFYYSDVLELQMGMATAIYMVASVWDGIANLAAGIYFDRGQSTRRYGAILVAGAVPLALTFVLTYTPPPVHGLAGILLIGAFHMLFRTAYAAVNVPYLVMSARISPDAGDRSFVAGARMLFGTAAVVSVALLTVPIGTALFGTEKPADAFFGAAIIFAVIGAAILLLVGATYRENAIAAQPPATNVRAALSSLAGNRAFATLMAAMMAMIVATTVLNKSVLYYFKYVLNDPAAGQLALATMGLISAVAVPLWMALGRIVGLRALWLITAGAGMVALALFAVFGIYGTLTMQIFLVGMQVMIVGLNFVFWALLPNTIEYGEQATGLHVEGGIFGVAALLQRIAIGIATAILGWSFVRAGYVANAQQSAATLAGMRATVALVPLAFLFLSCLAMIRHPLGHARDRRAAPEAPPQEAVI